MTHADSGHYAAKHPPGIKPDPTMAEAVRQKAANGRIACADTHKIAQTIGAPPSEIGVVIDLLELRIGDCQLGLFGHRPKKKILKPADRVPPDLEETIKESIKSGRVPCLSCWEIADRLGLSRIDAAAACEALKIKISPCQLGAF